MELLNLKIPWTNSDHRPIVIAPLGDIQWAGKNGPTSKALLKEHIAKCQELGAYYVGLGDYIDFASPSNRLRIKGAALYDTAEDVISEKALDLVLELYQEYLQPTKGRWLGMVHGHHWYPMKSGDTSDQRLCQLLDTTFLGTSAYIRVTFLKKLYKPGHSPPSLNITMFVHHGSGGGQKGYAPLMKLENLLPYWDADIFLLGHMTKIAAAPINRITPRWVGPNSPDLVHRKIHIVGCGGFAKGYDLGVMQGTIPMGGYVEQKMMNPTMLGAPIIRIVPRISQKEQPRKANGARSKKITWSPEVTVEV
jgi:hypothetical protein